MSSTESLSQAARALLESYRVPGAALSITRDGEPVYRECFGQQSLDAKAPVTESATFDIGSISKTFNAAAAALLVEEGKLSWDDRAVDLLPSFALSDPSLSAHVRLRDLLGQSVGFGEDNITNYNSHFTRAQIVDQIRYLPLRAAFRRECAYQQYGPLAAAAIVERLSGRSWEDFVEERVCAPLGLQETFATYFRKPAKLPACRPHLDLGDGRMSVIPHRNFDALAPTGAMVSSLRDMEVWFGTHAMGGAFGKRRLLKPDTVEEMLTPGVPVRRHGIHPQRWVSRYEANLVSYCIGWYAHDFQGYRVNEHTGALEGFFVMGCAVPSERLAVVILTNQHGSAAVHPLRYLLLAHGLGLPQSDWDARFRKVSKGAKRAPILWNGEPYPWRPANREKIGPNRPLAEFAGDYRHPGFEIIPLRHDGAQGSIDVVGNSCDVEHWHRDLYRAVPRDPGVRAYFPEIFFGFETDVAGRDWLVIPTIGRFRRIGWPAG